MRARVPAGRGGDARVREDGRAAPVARIAVAGARLRRCGVLHLVRDRLPEHGAHAEDERRARLVARPHAPRPGGVDGRRGVVPQPGTHRGLYGRGRGRRGRDTRPPTRRPDLRERGGGRDEGRPAPEARARRERLLRAFAVRSDVQRGRHRRGLHAEGRGRAGARREDGRGGEPEGRESASRHQARRLRTSWRS